jgi:hypothetical protein
MRIDGEVALANLVREDRLGRYPDREDPRFRNGVLFPDGRPSFQVEPGATIFTIGSCFARNIEEHLGGFRVPTLGFSAPQEEWPHRPNGLLNEYNAGTICQRIERAFAGEPAPDETLVQTADGGWADLLLLGGADVPTRERGLERRREIDDVYRELPTADLVIVTLGLVEAWYDRETKTFLNRLPPTILLPSGRYELHVMDVYDVWPLLERAFRLLSEQQVVVTVSPVPLNATFSGEDAIVANGFSKAVLRVCAQRLAKFSWIDYLPSYETVVSGGTAVLHDDNIHVRDETVAAITSAALEGYVAHELPLRGGLQSSPYERRSSAEQ